MHDMSFLTDLICPMRSAVQDARRLVRLLCLNLFVMISKTANSVYQKCGSILVGLFLVGLGPTLSPELHQAHARQLTVNNELFIEITEMVVPIIQRRRVEGFFSITLAVDCPTIEVSNKVKKYMPIIRDKFFWDMYILLGVIWAPDFRTDISELKARLKKRINQILGSDQVNDILIINFQQHERRNEYVKN